MTALKTDTSESSRPGWEVAKPGTSQAVVPAGVPFLQNYPNNNIEYQVPVQAEDKQEQLDSTFEDNMDIVKNNDTKTNTHPEPQPSSSKMNRKAFKRNNVYPFTSRNTKVSKLESAFNKKCQMKVQQGKVSKSYLSVGTPSSKECNTSHVAEKVQLIDPTVTYNFLSTNLWSAAWTGKLFCHVGNEMLNNTFKLHMLSSMMYQQE